MSTSYINVAFRSVGSNPTNTSGGEKICITIRGREQFNDAKRMMQSMMQIATELAALQKKAKQQRAVGAPAHKPIEAIVKKQTSVSEELRLRRIPTYLRMYACIAM